MQHLLFYDGNCGLCDRAVQFVLAHDDNKQFVFAPLQGETAKSLLQNLSPEQKSLDTLILIENYLTPDKKVYFMGQGALRIAWLLGSPYALLGSLSFLPSYPFDAGYKLVARNRHRFFDNACVVPNADNKARFLP